MSVVLALTILLCLAVTAPITMVVIWFIAAALYVERR